ncbi:hypothetical protein QT381_00635 [Galbitalea sp. SE-J8]|uniref:hypothetical protein n=1 Tax=Galbitalea sp. SE-J8 TaxID=3054952 RepID=UPI00259C6A6D|nr:hypothetical protein [Galbitalea sp. SE-J8]MDM4761514.1 hypothetical protein [Galbitalea sp. SE-J8]
MARRGSDSEQPDEAAPAAFPAAVPADVPTAEKLPAGDPSMYILTGEVEAERASRAKKRPPGGGPVKPPTLPADEYVVRRADAGAADAEGAADAAGAAGGADAADAPADPAADANPVGAATDRATGHPAAGDPAAGEPATGAPAAAPTAPTMPTAPTVPIGPAPTGADATGSPGASEAPAVVYRDRPVPPKPHGNRAFGVLITVLGAVLYAVLFAFAVLIVFRAITGVATMDLLANPGYWIPVGLFVVVQIASVLVLNRASWWAHIIASAVVAVVVYFGSGYLVGLVELYAWRSDLTYASVLGAPTSIVAGLLAREIALWAGAVIARRGRSVRARNAAERTAFEAANPA